MSLLDSSWYADRPVHPDKKPLKVPMTEWEYQEKHGLDNQKGADSDFSDPSTFSFSSDVSMDSDGPELPKKERPPVKTSAPSKIGEALKSDLDFISTSHNMSMQRRDASEREMQETISSARYTYFNDLDAEAQFSDVSFSDDFDSSSKTKTNKYGISDALESELMTCGVQNLNSSQNKSSFVVRKSQSAKMDSSGSNYDFDNSTSKISKLSPTSSVNLTQKSSKANTNADTISTMQDISSFHDTMTSDFKLESTNEQTKKEDTDKPRKSVTITESLASTKENYKKTADSDLLASNDFISTNIATNTQTLGDSLLKSSTISKKTTITCKSETDTNRSSLYSRVLNDLTTTDKNNKSLKEKYQKEHEEDLKPYRKFNAQPVEEKIPEFMKEERLELVQKRKEESLKRKIESMKKNEEISRKLEESMKKREMTDERIEYKPRPLKDKSPRFLKEDRTSLKAKKNESKPVEKKKKYELIPDEEDLIKERKLKKLIGEQKVEEIGEKVPPPPPKQHRSKTKHRDEEEIKEVSEKERKAFYDPATTKATQLRNQMVRQKIVQQAEADRLKREEEDARIKKEIKVAARIEPDLRRLREQSEVKTKSLSERKKAEEEAFKRVSKETRKMLKRVEKNPSLFNREGQDLTRKEARHKAMTSSARKTDEQLHWEAVRARRDAKNQELRKMWTGNM